MRFLSNSCLKVIFLSISIEQWIMQFHRHVYSGAFFAKGFALLDLFFPCEGFIFHTRRYSLESVLLFAFYQKTKTSSQFRKLKYNTSQLLFILTWINHNLKTYQENISKTDNHWIFFICSFKLVLFICYFQSYYNII